MDKCKTIDVGILAAPQIRFSLVSGLDATVTVKDGRLSLDEYSQSSAGHRTVEPAEELYFTNPSPSDAFFTLEDVVIGIDFHWQRRQRQTFAGDLRLIPEGGLVRAINRIGVEDYILSVISSEMKASASLEFLKAHAVISRSWALVNKNHDTFDVCADDHCQRYQGLGVATGETVRRAVEETVGEVLTFDGKICDTRFSKCCGGVSELFSTCWEDMDPPYLRSAPDSSGNGDEPFCNTQDTAILSQVLNDYDLETMDFYRWEEHYTRASLSDLVRRRTGIDFGTITDLIPLRKGPSGRIFELEITGEKTTARISKELAIRRALSESHLKSSAFEIEWSGDELTLHGKGWGHGVGLCQIGAAVMAEKGYSYSEILAHYYPGSKLEKL